MESSVVNPGRTTNHKRKFHETENKNGDELPFRGMVIRKYKPYWYYDEAVIDGETFYVDDIVHISGEADKPYVAQVLAFLRETERDKNFVRVKWFYRRHEVKDPYVAKIPGDIFESAWIDEIPLESIVEKVKVTVNKPELNENGEPESYWCPASVSPGGEQIVKLNERPLPKRVSERTWRPLTGENSLEPKLKSKRGRKKTKKFEEDDVTMVVEDGAQTPVEPGSPNDDIDASPHQNQNQNRFEFPDPSLEAKYASLHDVATNLAEDLNTCQVKYNLWVPALLDFITEWKQGYDKKMDLLKKEEERINKLNKEMEDKQANINKLQTEVEERLSKVKRSDDTVALERENDELKQEITKLKQKIKAASEFFNV